MRQAFFGAFWPSSRCRFLVQPSVTLSMKTAMIRLKMPMVTKRNNLNAPAAQAKEGLRLKRQGGSSHRM